MHPAEVRDKLIDGLSYHMRRYFDMVVKKPFYIPTSYTVRQFYKNLAAYGLVRERPPVPGKGVAYEMVPEEEFVVPNHNPRKIASVPELHVRERLIRNFSDRQRLRYEQLALQGRVEPNNYVEANIYERFVHVGLAIRVEQSPYNAYEYVENPHTPQQAPLVYSKTNQSGYITEEPEPEPVKWTRPKATYSNKSHEEVLNYYENYPI